MKTTKARTVLAVAVAAVAVGSASAGYVARGGSDSHASPVAAAASPTATSVASKSLTVNQVYKAAASGVVELTVTSGAASSTPFPGGGSGSQTALGSGFVFDASGDILTNQHVVDGATSVKVHFSDGTTKSATVVGSDPSSDVAVVKVSSLPSGVQPLSLGTAGSLQVGDGVVAIGSPFGLENTVTTGIVSALNRDIQSPNGFTIAGTVQTDAAINHGNSGGPLLDLNGKVVGINAQIESNSGGNEGVGFAIPAETVQKVAGELIAGKAITHAYLGVTIGDGSGGAVVGKVQAGTPAADAGLKAGDVITAANGKSVTSASALRAAIEASSPGDTVKLDVLRSGSTKTYTVKLGTRPANA